MRIKYLVSGFLLLSLSALLVACPEGPVGIFASIGAEKDINSSRTKAFEKTSPGWIAKLGDTYWLGNGSLWQMAEGKSWSKANTSAIDEGERLFATSGTVAGPVADKKLYVIFKIPASNSFHGIYSFDGTAWSGSPIALPGDEDGKTVRLFSADDTLFLVCSSIEEVDNKKVEKHRVYYLAGNDFTDTGLDLDSIPGGIAHYNGSFYISAGKKVFSGSASSYSEVSDTPATFFTGVVAIDDGIILTSNSGRIYYYDGSGWEYTEVFGKKEKEVIPYYLHSPTVLEYDGITVLLAGTAKKGSGKQVQANGYLEFDISDGFDKTMEPATNPRLITDIYNFDYTMAGKPVNGLAAFTEGTDNRRVFILSAGRGLWSNLYDGEWSSWYKE